MEVKGTEVLDYFLFGSDGSFNACVVRTISA